MATALTSELTRFTDKCNNVLAGGIVKTFEPNSLTPKTTYQDPECTIPNFPEITLDETGRAKIYILGDYRIQVYSRDGILIEDNLLVEQSLVQRDFVELSQVVQEQLTNELQVFEVEKEEAIQDLLKHGGRAYPTLALANADIANIALDTKVSVLSETDGGDYYKATAGATSLTKSAYDPLEQAKKDFYASSKVEIAFKLASQGQKINTDGSLVSWGNGHISDKLDISILNQNKIVFENLSTTTACLIIAFYTSSDTFISGIGGTNNTVFTKTQDVTVPPNASYFRIAYNNALSIGKMYKVATQQTAADSLLANIATINTAIQKTSRVKVSASMVGGDYAINNDGSLIAWGNISTSQPISTIGISYIAADNLSAKSNGGYCVAFYDSNGAIITSGSLLLTANQIVSSTGLIAVPVNAFSFRYCYNKTLSTATVYAVSAQYAYDLLKSEMLALVKPYASKKILSLGDSYTWLNYYGSALADTTGCTQRARGQNGNMLKSFCNDSYTGADGNPVAEVFDAALLAQYDIVTIMGGTNDYGHGAATLGTIADTKDQNTIYGSVKFLIDKIQTLKPTIKIVFVTQPFRLQYSTETAPGGYLPNSNGLTMQNIASAIKECASLYGCPVYDFYALSGWNEFTIKKNAAGNWNDNIYTYDGLHPRQGTGKGGEMLGQGLGRLINQL